MRRLHVFLITIPVIVLIVVLTGWNPTSAEDQTVDFRLNQIMVRLNQIEWELSRVRNRQGTQSERLDEIDTKLDRILEEMAGFAPMEPASSSTATDPALWGTWRLTRHDFAEEIPDKMRRYLEEQAEQAEESWRKAYRSKRIDERIEKTIDGFEKILDQSGFRLIRFRSDGMYKDGAGDDGTWLVSGNRLVMTTFDGRTFPSTYSVDDAGLTLTFTGDQIGTLFSLEAEREVRRNAGNHRQYLKYTDRVRLIYTKDF